MEGGPAHAHACLYSPKAQEVRGRGDETVHACAVSGHMVEQLRPSKKNAREKQTSLQQFNDQYMSSGRGRRRGRARGRGRVEGQDTAETDTSRPSVEISTQTKTQARSNTSVTVYRKSGRLLQTSKGAANSMP